MSYAHFIIDQLVCQGVRHFCIAPGSRSSPLALAVANHQRAKAVVHYDERGLGFFSLGIGKATMIPSVVITTSGTAVCNLLPSVAEAHMSMTPMIVLTADRPKELHFCGANQTMDQTKIFGDAVSFHIDLPHDLDETPARSIATQAFFSSLQNPPGPVHINCQFKEPLHLEPKFKSGQSDPLIIPKLIASPLRTKAEKGIILIGELKEDPEPILKLAKRLQWPIFADLLSNARKAKQKEQIQSFDRIIQEKSPKPDFILQFGGRFISKRILDWEQDVPLTHVSPYPRLENPTRRVHQKIQSDIEPFCNSFAALSDPSWLRKWQDLDKKALLKENQKQSTEAKAIALLPTDKPIFFGNSMPVRIADSLFYPKESPKLFANRGVSGIDGNIATIAGIAEGLQEGIIGFIGDQTALHDLNSLPLIKRHKILLLISNNFGGKIFEQLPVRASCHLDKFFVASHPYSFKEAAKMFDIPYERKETDFTHLPPYGIVELF